MAEALVASENVGEGGPGDLVLLPDIARERKERAEGMVVVVVGSKDIFVRDVCAAEEGSVLRKGKEW